MTWSTCATTGLGTSKRMNVSWRGTPAARAPMPLRSAPLRAALPASGKAQLVGTAPPHDAVRSAACPARPGTHVPLSAEASTIAPSGSRIAMRPKESALASSPSRAFVKATDWSVTRASSLSTRSPTTRLGRERSMLIAALRSIAISGHTNEMDGIASAFVFAFAFGWSDALCTAAASAPSLSPSRSLSRSLSSSSSSHDANESSSSPSP